MTDVDTVLVERPRPGVMLIQLDDHATRNALTPSTVGTLRATLADADADPAVKVVVLTGRGSVFCSGGNTKGMGQARPRPLERKRAMWSNVQRMFQEIHRLDMPLLVAINGPAVGAGVDLALHADIRLMAETATLRASYVDLGVVPGGGGAHVLPRIVGTARALEILWTGRTVAATEAERLGIVSHVVPDGALLEAALDLAGTIASKPLQSLQLIKRMVHQSHDVPLDAALDAASSHFAMLQETDDHAEGIAALAQRRAPTFEDH
jgi:enoyl-CoA hydratase/carnithine racemase